MDLLDFTDKNKLNTPESIFSFIEKSSIEEIVEIVTEAYALTNLQKASNAHPSLFNFSASHTLSGGSFPCEHPRCRLSSVATLGKFASGYADSVTIYNPFEFIYPYLGEYRKLNLSTENSLRRESTIAFLTIYELKPLIERGIIHISRTIELVCYSCKRNKEKLLDKSIVRFEDISKEKVYPELLKEVKLVYEKNYVLLEGAEDIFGRGYGLSFKQVPKFLKDKAGNPVTQMKNLKFENPLIHKMINEAIKSLLSQKVNGMDNLTRTYLTNNKIEKMLLDGEKQVADGRELTLIANNLPVLRDASYDQILDIRDRYASEFQSFQELVSNILTKAKNFEFQQEYSEFVNNELEKRIQEMKEILNQGRKKFVKRGLFSGGFLGFSAILSTQSNYDISWLFALADSLRQCRDTIIEVDNYERKMKTSPVYFYYRLSEKIN